MSASCMHTASLPCPYSAAEAFLRLRHLPGCAWLDSARPAPQADGRWSLLCVQPFARLRLSAEGLEHIDYTTGTTTRLHGDPLDELECLLRRYSAAAFASATTDTAVAQAPTSGIAIAVAAEEEENTAAAEDFTAPFFSSGGGAVGFFSYELGRQWEAGQPLPERAPGFPLMDWAFYNCAIRFDHSDNTACVLACSTNCYTEAEQTAQALLAQLNAPLQSAAAKHSTANCSSESACHTVPSISQTSREAYIEAVAQTREYIAQGDIYQTNIAQYFSAPLTCHASDLYLRLRELNPAPYAAYLDTGAHQILSSSPELFLQRRGRRLRTRPIKGTRPRGRTTEEDAQQQRELLGSEKERAELLMIVDLERNDLGRVCRTGSVRVDALYRIESYATVHHLVADVSGTQREGTTLRDLLRATFPGGSITGAPKVRAMQIIDELEGQQRGIFCGAIGAIGFDGAIDLNIAIRTMQCSPHACTDAEGQPPHTTATPSPTAPLQSQIHFGAGAGLVWDSNPAHEYEETLHKARALLEAIRTQPTSSD